MVSKHNQEAAFPLVGHFADPQQQIEAGKLGMWLFLAALGQFE